MLKQFSPLFIVLLLVFFTWYLISFTKPRNVEIPNVPDTEFSTLRAFEHVNNMAREPHYVGSAAHNRVRNYIVNELQEMNLEVQTQEGYVLNNTGVLSFSRNILARIPGSGEGKAVVLMSHYDSAGHSSPGASDAASGVAVILEGIRAFVAGEENNRNDIIILITDTEEVGLLGAQLFVKKHPWAGNVGVALNFESRGSGGDSYLLLETNGGNAGLIKEFKKAKPDYPVTNSLAYSIYKMLPNDTDLTVLREQGNIDGYNFAFIDDHFDYHTANDTPGNLDIETLAHQGSYLVPLLKYFKDADLSKIREEGDLMYSSLPGGKIISYPFSWIYPLLIVAFLLFTGVVGFGVIKRKLNFRSIFKGAIPFFISLVGSALLVYLLWQFCLMIYPEYREMEHGFTYNGYWYIAAMLFLTLTLNFMVYHLFRKVEMQSPNFVFPVFFWLIVCTLAAFFLKGAAYFIIPAFFAIIQLALMLHFKRPNPFLMLLLSLPALIFLLPFITTFPVALGLGLMFSSAILLTLLFTLFIPVFGYFRHQKGLGLLSFLIFNILFITAHFKSSFTEDRPKPNSLVYILDDDAQKASWNSYDNMADPWTEKYFGEDPDIISASAEDFSSKYRSNFTYKAEAPLIEFERPGIIFEQLDIADSIQKKGRYSLKIAPNRNISRIEIFADRNVNFEEFSVNGLKADSVALGSQNFHMFTRRWQNRLLTYHAANRDTLRLEFIINAEELPEFTLYEASYDLLENDELQVAPREKGMIPRPFVLNDAIVRKQSIRFE
ncbi:M20/M25/M40 family metallo-hydrolase [soil metagenome]